MVIDMEYQPGRAPNPDTWLAMTEQERIESIHIYHHNAGIQPPNPQLHAAIHAVVETQIAMGQVLPVGDTLARLISEGLDRHEAIHAIGSVLLDHIYNLMGSELSGLSNENYFEALNGLSAQSWLESE